MLIRMLFFFSSLPDSPVSRFVPDEFLHVFPPFGFTPFSFFPCHVIHRRLRASLLTPLQKNDFFFSPTGFFKRKTVRLIAGFIDVLPSAFRQFFPL